MRGDDKLFLIELDFIVLARWDIEVSLRIVRRVWKKSGWTWSGIIVVIYFTFWVLHRTLKKGYTLNYSSNKNFNLF